jgi:hypothetical protein
MNKTSPALRLRFAVVVCAVAALGWCGAAEQALAVDAPVPLLAKGKPVYWWFIYEFNSKPPFNLCGDTTGTRSCPFGGKVRTKDGSNYSQQFVFASSDKAKDAGKLMQGKGCVGTIMTDPLGATFDEVYNGTPFFLIWNDQFYGDPTVKACGSSGNCDSPWGIPRACWPGTKPARGWCYKSRRRHGRRPAAKSTRARPAIPWAASARKII